MLSHLVYVSSRKSNCTDAEIEKILDACKRNNGSIDITGVLLYSDTQFVQYIEGPYKKIIGLYDKIKLDDRHKNAVMISNSPIEKRLFPNWQMGSRRLKNQAIEYKTELTDSDEKLFNSILSGEFQEGNKALNLLQKFFK